MRHERTSPSGRYVDVDGKTVPIEEIEAAARQTPDPAADVEPVETEEPSKRGRK